MGDRITEQDYIDAEIRHRKEEKKNKAIENLTRYFSNEIEEYGVEGVMARLVYNLYCDNGFRDYGWMIDG